ncbi:MAG: chloride channel protein [Phycisphaerales bacterium]|nr:chloride channel protein [Phycisphaerales bacterium]
MPRKLANKIRRLPSRLGFGREWWLLVLAMGVGLLMGVAALAFIEPIQWFEHLAANWAGNHGNLLIPMIIIVPVVGALLTGTLLRLVPAQMKGHGVSSVIYAVSRSRSRLRSGLLVRQWAGSTLTIGSGGSAGPEGPIVTIGAVIGSKIGQLLRLDAQDTATLLGCGAAAGLASVFNAPIAGIFFVLEVILRDFSLRTFTPIVVASVLSAATTQTILGSNEPIFGVGPEFFSAVEGNLQFNIFATPVFLVLGIVCGIVAFFFTRSLQLSEHLFGKIPIPGVFKPACGALLLGLLGVGFVFGSGFFSSLSSAVQPLPPFFGTGYEVVKNLIDPAFYSHHLENLEDNGIALIVIGLLLVAMLKIVATSLTLGSGGAGGLFAPAIVVGAIVGSLFGVIVESLGWFPQADPAHYALVGMAAMVAATTHAPMTGVLLVYELTQTYSLIVPLLLTAVIATIMGRLLYRDSIYTAELNEAGVRLGGMSDLTLLRHLTVRDVPLVPPILVKPDDTGQRLLELSERFAVSDFVVVDENERYVGMVTAADLQAALVYREAIPLLQVNEMERTDLPSVSPEDTLDVVLDRFSEHDAACLPVLNSPQDGQVVGVLTRIRLMREYQHALERD